MTRLELLAVLLVERYGPDAALDFARDVERRQLIDDLPPDNRDRPAIIIRARP